MSCLRSMHHSPLTFRTFRSGEVLMTSQIACGPKATPDPASGGLTSEVTIAADRILVLILVERKFSEEARFISNDRDISHYDVEIYEKGAAMRVLLDAPPLPTDLDIAGCPPSGPIDCTYSVDLRKDDVKLAAWCED